MKNNKIQIAKKVFYDNNGYARTRDLIGMGLNHSHIKKLEEEGLIIRIKRGLYKWLSFEINNYDELVEATKLVPKGVVCLLSALSYYDLTTYNPWEYYIAIHRDDTQPKNIDYPPIKLVYFSDQFYFGGIQEVIIHGHKVKIYDKEKTLCDCIRFRNKIGIDIVREALKNYINSHDKNITKLVQYSKDYRVKSILKRYLEVL